jgi:hypothetical protein
MEQFGGRIMGRNSGSGVSLGGLLGAVSELRHRVRHRLILLAAYGPGYGRPDPEQSKISMPPWTEDPYVPMAAAKSAPATPAPPKSRNTSGHAA